MCFSRGSQWASFVQMQQALLCCCLGVCLMMLFARYCPVLLLEGGLCFSLLSEQRLWWVASSLLCGLMDDGCSQRLLNWCEISQQWWVWPVSVNQLERDASVACISVHVLKLADTSKGSKAICLEILLKERLYTGVLKREKGKNKADLDQYSQ